MSRTINIEEYKLFNLTEWLATGLVSRTLVCDLEGRGVTTFQVTQGNLTNVELADEAFLSVNMLDQNPFYMDGCTIRLDEDTQDVYWGFEVTS